MLDRCAIRDLSRLLVRALAACLLSVCCYSETVYFLAATTTNNGQDTYPSSLYVRGTDSKLSLVRVVSPSSYYVQECEGRVISVSYPPVLPTHVSVIDMSDPGAPDDIAINSASSFVLDRHNALSVARSGGPVEQLLGLTKGLDSGGDVDIEKVSLLSSPCLKSKNHIALEMF
jgi:hypothetical protein